MNASKLPLYVLQEAPDVSDIINSPLKSSLRIKYTSIDISKSLITFGATSGGIYVFNRSPCELVQLIPSKDGAITRLAISPNERFIAFANGRGVVTVTKCDQTVPHKTVTSKEHSGNEVTALIWGNNTMVFAADDIGRVSVLQLPNIITKTMFQSLSQIIMNLDSRICQLDTKDTMLLVSTLTRCYICDTAREQYRQIGQKLRDGEFGACFVTLEKLEHNRNVDDDVHYTEVKKYNIVDSDAAFAVNEKLVNTMIYSARPSSRVWEASIEGTVVRTHQYKQVLARSPVQIVSLDSYINENVVIEESITGVDGRPCNFPKMFSLNKSAILSFKKDAIYILDIGEVNNTVWIDTYKDIIDCKYFRDSIYVWLQNGSLIHLKLMKIDKFIIKCYLEDKYSQAIKLCALFSKYLQADKNISNKLHILVGLRNKLNNNDNLNEIEDVLKRFEELKPSDVMQTKSGIYIVDNTYQTLFSDGEDNTDVENKDTSPGEALQTLKDLSISVSDKFSTSKKKIKEKWEGFEDKVKNFSGDKIQPVSCDTLKRPTERNNIKMPILEEGDIVYKLNNHKEDVDTGNDIKTNEVLWKSLYQHFRLSIVGESSDLRSIMSNHSCDIEEIYRLILDFRDYCISIGAGEDSKRAPNMIFLEYLDKAENKGDLLDEIIANEHLYEYFFESCIIVNVKTKEQSNACECGFPLPFSKTTDTELYPEIIDMFLEKQLSNQTPDQVCKKTAYMWRKILYLRRHFDMQHILQILLQMLDENLLHSFLPQFTLEIWDRAIELYAVLHANRCVNCLRPFSNITVKTTLSWADLGAMMIKTVGGRNAVKLMEKHSELIGVGELSVTFYHACMLTTLYAQYDRTLIGALTDTIYSTYEYDHCRSEICSLLNSASQGIIRNTALPITVAAHCKYWGLATLHENLATRKNTQKPADFDEILENFVLLAGNTDCRLCGLPLANQVLIKDGGLSVFKCGHTFHGACLNLNNLKLCSACSVNV